MANEPNPRLSVGDRIVNEKGGVSAFYLTTWNALLALITGLRTDVDAKYATASFGSLANYADDAAAAAGGVAVGALYRTGSAIKVRVV